jgi:alpha-beta hydrolase superfamily lysophospholipase
VHQASLTKRPVDGSPRGLVLMLHGGADRGTDPIDHRSLAWRRARWMMHEIQGELHDAGLSVWLLRYRVRGWNHGHDELPSPIPDARWALDEVRREHGPLPVVLLGHSMGGRTAVAVADDPNVVGVVALAPWLPRDEPIEAVAGKHLAAAHGRRDKITRLKDTRYYVQRAADVAASSSLTEMESLGHYMLRGRGRWNRFAADNTVKFLVT